MSRHSHKGFTLIELVVTIMLLGILGSVVGVALTEGVLAFRASNEVTDTLSKLRLASERMAREIRTVRRNPADTSSYHFTARNADSMTFQRIASDGVSVETVTIDGSSGSTVTLGYGTDYTLTDQVSSFSFSYYQSDGTTTASAQPVNNDIAFVEFELELTDNNGNTYPQRTRVALRNLQ